MRARGELRGRGLAGASGALAGAVGRWRERCGARERAARESECDCGARERAARGSECDCVARERAARGSGAARGRGRPRGSGARSMRSGIDELDTSSFSPMRIRPRLGASCQASTSFRDGETVSLFFLLSLHLF